MRRSLHERTLAERCARRARALGRAAMEHVEAARRDDAPVDLGVVMAAFHQPLEIEIVAVHVMMDEDGLGLPLGERDQILARQALGREQDRKSTRLNSSHSSISYAVFC